MRILVAPLNWGLGHASRCVPLIHRFLDEGHEVILGGDGASLTLLRRHFPQLRYVYLAPLNLRYSAGQCQVWAMIKAIPQLIRWAIKDHLLLRALLREEPFDLIISDNRFGLFLPSSYRRSRSYSETVLQQSDPTGEAGQTQSVYITHQLHIMLPKGWRWAEGIASRLHARIYTRYNKVWIPDYEAQEQSLAGKLSHPTTIVNRQSSNRQFEYIGPLSRFEIPRYRDSEIPHLYDVIAVLSGLEPQRSLLEKELIERFVGKEERVLIVQGLLNRPNTRLKHQNITVVPSLNDQELVPALLSAKHIIARSGYSTIMDLHALGLIKNKEQKDNYQLSIINYQLELIPTPGQPEQAYLAKWIAQNDSFL
ncbi:MAG: hypothetical protein IJS82_00755 [Paludibacteraceae bacterium]|nr:hypothetical protein [Paludibacteraceae bacterium]